MESFSINELGGLITVCAGAVATIDKFLYFCERVYKKNANNDTEKSAKAGIYHEEAVFKAAVQDAGWDHQTYELN